MPNILSEDKTGFKLLPEDSTDDINYYRKEINGEELCDLWITFGEKKKIHFEILYKSTLTNKISPASYEYSGEMSDSKVLEFYERYLQDSKK